MKPILNLLSDSELESICNAARRILARKGLRFVIPGVLGVFRRSGFDVKDDVVYIHPDQLDQALSGAGFDADKDIEAITVNRWAHGYSYSPGRMWDPEYGPDADKPWVVGRRPFGRITIANSDAGGLAYLDAAIDQAWRAVGELSG